MKVILFSILCLVLYVLLVWLSAKDQENPKKAYLLLLQATLFTLCVLWPILFLSLFWVLFVAVLLMVFATYLASQKGLFGKLVKNGVFGGIWLSIPLYIYLLSNT